MAEIDNEKKIRHNFSWHANFLPTFYHRWERSWVLQILYLYYIIILVYYICYYYLLFI